MIVGTTMAAHGWQKLQGAANFGAQILVMLGVPLPVLTGYLVTFAELIGGILLVIGLAARLAALVLTVDLVVAILLVKIHVGFTVPLGLGAGAEFDLALIAEFLVVLLAGPGKLSLDYLLGLERETRAQRDREGGT